MRTKYISIFLYNSHNRNRNQILIANICMHTQTESIKLNLTKA